MTPGRVAPHQDDQISQIQILIASRHSVRAEGALVPRYGRSHAKPGVGIYISRAEEAFHQLIDDVVVLGQQLPGNVASDAVRAELAQCLCKTFSHRANGSVPGYAAAIDLGVQQPSIEIEGIAQSRSF